MSKITATQKRALQEAHKHGFVFAGDGFFKSFRSAKIALSGLVKIGLLVLVNDDFGTQYVLTNDGRDAVLYGV